MATVFYDLLRPQTNTSSWFSCFIPENNHSTHYVDQGPDLWLLRPCLQRTAKSFAGSCLVRSTFPRQHQHVWDMKGSSWVVFCMWHPQGPNEVPWQGEPLIKLPHRRNSRWATSVFYWQASLLEAHRWSSSVKITALITFSEGIPKHSAFDLHGLLPRIFYCFTLRIDPCVKCPQCLLLLTFIYIFVTCYVLKWYHIFLN